MSPRASAASRRTSFSSTAARAGPNSTGRGRQLALEGYHLPGGHRTGGPSSASKSAARSSSAGSHWPEAVDADLGRYLGLLVAAQLLFLAWPGAKNGREAPPWGP
ncbi:hypothetical protein [Streptomyces chartreusis]|uniref:hypothetical protein n=1 Tax=Streptomyces chartreusis TaxID=1969 RepID=UPI002E182187